MKGSDIALTAFIILVFILLYVFNILSIGTKNIQNEWPKYRCNPLVMPFAGYFGHDVGKTFTYCIQNTQSAYMGHLLKPVHYNLNVMGNVGNEITSAIHDARAFFSNLRGFIGSIISNVFGVFMNMLIEFQRITIKLKDMLAKIIGIMATQLYLISGNMMLFQSMNNGVPGQLVRGLCFHPNTLIEVENGELSKMKDVEIGTTLKSGGVVCATMKIKNFDEDGNLLETFYRIENGAMGEPIFVTGSHLVFDQKKREFVFVKDYEHATPCDEESKWFTCFITSDHLIPIGKHLFHDWEDNNGSPSKDLQ